MRTVMITAAMLFLACAAVRAQAPPPPAQPAPAQPGQQAAQTPPPAPENYTYQPEGRRDPFLNLLTGGTEGRVVSHRGEGPSGLSVSDISVRGVLQSRGSLVAMIAGPDNKTYLVHQGDKFLDGTVKSVTAQGLIIVQEVNDPLSLVKQREIRKFLRSVEDVK
jgi:Tfp pilus assembly protein PilP